MIISVEQYLTSIGVRTEKIDELVHYGTPRHSGRYPWGSGGDHIPQRNRAFLDNVNSMKKQGLSEKEIADGLGMTTTELRNAKSIAKNAEKQHNINEAVQLKDKGYSNTAIGEKLGLPEATVRSYLKESTQEKIDVVATTSDVLKNKVDTGAYVDIGVGSEHHMGITRTKLDNAVTLLKEQGYEVHKVQIDQVGTENKTTVKILSPPGTTYRDAASNVGNIQPVQAFSMDKGRSYQLIQPPLNISSSRIKVKYDEDGGSMADGVIYVRPGVKDISIGDSRYAQVRIAVDGTHYLKGMAVYKDDLPPGVDLVFNTNKKNTGDIHDAMKPMQMGPDGKPDAENPFGATIRQRVDSNGKVTSAMNIVGTKDGAGEEGSWGGWSKNLPSQFLSKQSPILAKQQLDVTYEQKKRELETIRSLTNPIVRKKLLESYADGVDSAAVHLKAAAMPRQSTHVILPVKSMKDNEVYAPNFKNGERVVLVRFPHGGTFEIPELVVNNNRKEAIDLLGKTAKDAIAINHKVAERLSGADFDGDTVLVIPNNNNRVKSTPPLAGLKDFDPKRSYPPYDGMKTIDGGTYNAATKKVEYGPKGPSSRKGMEMGLVSNLITDMTIMGAPQDEIARAVRHSMVVIDAEKHKLDFRESAQKNGIKQLKEKYQGGSQGGASTIISRATRDKTIKRRKLRPASEGGPIDPATGKKVYVDDSRPWVNAQGKTVYRKQRVDELSDTDNAHTLVSKLNTKIENIYADHSNRMKSLAREARKEQVSAGVIPYSSQARKVYDAEYKSLDAKLKLAVQNSPRERQAQIIANTAVRAKLEANPNLEKDQIKKLKFRELDQARIRVGAARHSIYIEDKEWEAIQAGALSTKRLSDVLDHADLDRVQKLATPRNQKSMTTAQTQRAQSMIKLGYTQAEVAEALGISITTLSNSLNP